MKLFRLTRIRKLAVTITCGLSIASWASASSTGDLVVVVGAPGEESYLSPFERTASAWVAAGEQAGLTTQVIGGAEDETSPSTQKERLRDQLETLPPAGAQVLWFVFVGHGTYDGRVAKLNLIGEDVSAAELRRWLAPIERPMVIVHGGSASAPFINSVSGPNRIVVTATESGNEINYTRFGEYFSTAITDPDADIDRDGQVSVLEAFVSASNHTQIFYDESGRLATEHALIDDNGDSRGTPFDWFNGTRIGKQARDIKIEPDGDWSRLLSLIPSPAEQKMTDAQRTERARLEAQVEALRKQKSALPEDDYYAQLEILFRQLGRVYGAADAVDEETAD
ncbi:MAG: hypothetical protein SynsKO_07790 [Synoicihabitans sp.]